VTVVSYTPSPTLASFHASNAFVRLIRGPIGSGKSVGCCWEIWTRACEQEPGPDGVRRSRWVATRNTYGELTTTTLRTWLDWFPEDRFGKVVHGAPIEQVCKWPLADGTQVELTMWFLALDRPEHVKKLLSLEITGGWMNEGREQPKAILDALTGRVGRYPSKRDGGATWFGVIADTNSPDTDHWWYTLDEQRPEEFAFFAQPAGDGPEAENVENLPPLYYERLKAGKTEEWIRVYVKGDYGYVQDGKPVYPEFRSNLHVGDFDLIKGLPLYGGMDFGLTPAGLWAQRKPNGQILIHRELVSEDMGVKRFGALWRQETNLHYPNVPIERITGDPAGNARGDDELDTFQVLKGEQVHAVPAFTNSFTIRREAFAAPMTRLVDGLPGILIHRRCKRLIKALAGGYHFKRVQVAGSERYHDAPDKDMHSHVAEAGQYLLLGMGAARDLRRPEGHELRRNQARHMATAQYRVLD
jgi:hypothetical protein